MYRTILNEIQHLIEKGNGATEVELKQLWNGLSNAITETGQLNLPPVIKAVCDCCRNDVDVNAKRCPNCLSPYKTVI